MGTSTRPVGLRGFAVVTRTAIGMPNARVLPEPVGARPQRSRPAQPSAMVRVWMGNGSVMPRRSSVVTRSGGTPRPVNPAGVMVDMSSRAPVFRRDGVSRGVSENPGTMTRTCVTPDVVGRRGPESRRRRNIDPCDTARRPTGPERGTRTLVHESLASLAEVARSQLRQPRGTSRDRNELRLPLGQLTSPAASYAARMARFNSSGSGGCGGRERE